MNRKKSSPQDRISEMREDHSPFHGVFFRVKKLLSSQHSRFQKIDVIENEYYGRILFLDGLVQTSDKDEFFYHEMLVHPALVSHPSPKNILLIGGGDGGAMKEILRYPVEKVWFVEIDSQVIDVSRKFFPWLKTCLKDERVKLIIADGKDFVQETFEKFDVVLVDSSEPVGPSTVLHEKAFYTNVKRCLNRNGIVVSQVGSPLYHLEQIKEKEREWREIFKVVRLYVSPVPTYPGGVWSFVYLSDETSPESVRRKPPSGLKYYNHEVHQAAFMLPNFIKRIL